MNQKKLRIVVKSYDHRLLDHTVKKIVNITKKMASDIIGPIPFPIKKEVFTILRSVHRHKDSREQLEIRTHKRVIDILEPNADILHKLKMLQLPQGIDIELKTD